MCSDLLLYAVIPVIGLLFTHHYTGKSTFVHLWVTTYCLKMLWRAKEGALLNFARTDITMIPKKPRCCLNLYVILLITCFKTLKHHPRETSTAPFFMLSGWLSVWPIPDACQVFAPLPFSELFCILCVIKAINLFLHNSTVL